MDKVPRDAAFLDVSDYARPFASWLVKRLTDTSVSPHHLTLAFTACGLAAAALLASDRWLPAAAGLLLLKSGLDAADGSLARARQRPSRVGRYLDSVCDFVVNLAVYAGIAAAAGSAGAGALAGAALVCGMLQVSIFNLYYVRYRTQTGGDRTSQADERAAQGFPWDNPRYLAPLQKAYLALYGWQDRLVAALDGAAGQVDRPLRPGFMTAATVLGLGTQLLVLAACTAFGRPIAALWCFVTVFNAYAVGLIVWRRLN